MEKPVKKLEFDEELPKAPPKPLSINFYSVLEKVEINFQELEKYCRKRQALLYKIEDE